MRCSERLPAVAGFGGVKPSQLPTATLNPYPAMAATLSQTAGPQRRCLESRRNPMLPAIFFPDSLAVAGLRFKR